MKIENAKKAAELLKEMNELSGCENILKDKKCHDVAHFELLQHYGNNPRKVIFN